MVTVDVRAVARSTDVLEKVIAGAVHFCFGCKFTKEQTATLSDITGKTDFEWKV